MDKQALMRPCKGAIIFDWSGTLVDDLPLVIETTNQVLAEYGHRALDRDEFRQRFRLPYEEFYRELLPEVEMEPLEDRFRYYFSRGEQKITPLWQAEEFLRRCRLLGYRCFILTSMDAAAFEEQLLGLGWEGYFEACYASVRDKRERIHEIIETHALAIAKTLYFGDMQHDVETARYAGLTSVALLTGYNDRSQLVQVKPDFLYENLAQVLESQFLELNYDRPSEHECPPFPRFH